MRRSWPCAWRMLSWRLDTASPASWTPRRMRSSARADRPDLVFCGIKRLGGDSGLDVGAALRPMGIFCLFISSNCPAAAIGRGLAFGDLLKPFQPSLLRDVVQAALSSYQGDRPEALPPGQTLHGGRKKTDGWLCRKFRHCVSFSAMPHPVGDVLPRLRMTCLPLPRLLVRALAFCRGTTGSAVRGEVA